MISKALAKEFQKAAGKQNVMTDEADRLTYSYDAAVLAPEMPALAVRPANREALGQVVRLCNENRLPLTVVTYHDPCHLKKPLGVTAEPRQIIQTADGYRLVEMLESDACCGMGGSFNLQHYDISSRIGGLKQENIRATGCEIAATGCPACMLQISEALSKAGARIAVKHPIQIYAEAINKR